MGRKREEGRKKEEGKNLEIAFRFMKGLEGSLLVVGGSLGWLIFLKVRNLEWTRQFCIIFGMLISKKSKFFILMNFFLAL